MGGEHSGVWDNNIEGTRQNDSVTSEWRGPDISPVA